MGNKKFKEYDVVVTIKPIKKKVYGRMMTVVREGIKGIVFEDDGKLNAVFFDKGEVHADVDEYGDCIKKLTD